MTKSQIQSAIRNLTVVQRIDLMEELVLSIAADQHALNASQKKMIDERLEEIEKFPGRGMSHAEFRRKSKEAKTGFRPSSRRKSA